MEVNGLVLSGAVVLVLTFLFLNVYITQDQKTEASQYDALCNTNLGQFVQAFSNSTEQKCADMSNLKAELDYGPVGYVLGAVLVIAGFFMSNKIVGRRK